jgi:hypothetical protein
VCKIATVEGQYGLDVSKRVLYQPCRQEYFLVVEIREEWRDANSAIP